jgi:ribonucleases P/MRP protein subunit RPP40
MLWHKWFSFSLDIIISNGKNPENFISSWEKVTSGVPQRSVLGPILFIIFINEISELLMSINELYADDTKLIKEINSEYDAIMPQDDIDKIVAWTITWLMRLNENKCKIMYIGAEKSNNVFTIESYDGAIRSNLVETTLERDLGVMISADLKWRNHVMYCANKANKVLGMLLRTFEYRDLDLIKSLYTTFVRPHLEFAVSVWSPHMQV